MHRQPAGPDRHDGIEQAQQRLDATTGFHEHAMIVLTDGMETADKRISTVADTINERGSS